MADNRSKVVIQGNENKHTSRLVKAIGLFDHLSDFSLKPDGVWGSTATIKCNGVTLKSSELDFEFDVPFDDNLVSNEGEITVYNLSNNTLRYLKKGYDITIEAGYEGDTGLIYDGCITKASTKREGADRVTTIKVSDDIRKNESLNLTFDSGTKASYILEKLLERTKMPIATMPIARFIRRDWTYENAVTIDETLPEAIKKYSEVCGIRTFVNNGKIYSCSLNQVDYDVRFVVSEDTGMIGSPMPFSEEISVEEYNDTEEGFEIEMLLQHRMTTGARIELKSEDYNGKYYVKSGRHIFNESSATTTIKVIEI